VTVADAEVIAGRALVVDDERDLADVVAGYLRRDGFETTLAHDGPGAVSAARQTDPDLVVLDLNLPGLDGIEVCRQLRTFTDCYIIMLTARTEEVDMLIGLAVGADDYMTKPFSPRELSARVAARMRRSRSSTIQPDKENSDPDVIIIGDLTIRLASREASLDGRPLELTRIEFDLLATLASEPKVVFSRSQLISSVWSGEWFGDGLIAYRKVLMVRGLAELLATSSHDNLFIADGLDIRYRSTVCSW
jgi:DNA-binding response OmpR family regulator